MTHKPPKVYGPCSRLHAEDFWFVALLILGVLLFAGCSTVPIRLGSGDCVVLADRDQVIVAGSGCQMQRLYR